MAMRVRQKYGAKRTEVDGIVFASQKEARRYQELKLLQKAGHIVCLTLQPEYKLTTHNGKVIGKYVADFAYNKLNEPGTCGAGSKAIVEDVKGFKTPLYRWKKKHVEAQYGIQILET